MLFSTKTLSSMAGLTRTDPSGPWKSVRVNRLDGNRCGWEGGGRMLETADTPGTIGLPGKLGTAAMHRTVELAGTPGLLGTVGIEPTEERVYWTLLRLPAASSGELAQRLNLAPEQSSDCLTGLESKGLVSRAPGDPLRFRAAPPDLAFGPLLHRRQQELRSVEAAVGQMTDEYRSRPGRDDDADPIELIDGGTAVRQRFTQLWLTAAVDACAFVADPADADLADWSRPVAGVPARIVYPHAALDHDADPYRLADSVRGGAAARLAPTPPVTMLVVDGRTAIVRVPPRRAGSAGPAAVHVRRGALLDALVALFEAVWAPAVPLVRAPAGVARAGGPAPAPAAEDLRLLTLLLAGLTDDAIASKLGLSRRTVQRRVSGLIELAGVRTRLQLMWQSTRRGWI